MRVYRTICVVVVVVVVCFRCNLSVNKSLEIISLSCRYVARVSFEDVLTCIQRTNGPVNAHLTIGQAHLTVGQV